MTIEERIENLKKEQEKAKELFFKCQGAIEILSSMVEEETENKAHSQSHAETLKGSHKEDK